MRGYRRYLSATTALSLICQNIAPAYGMMGQEKETLSKRAPLKGSTIPKEMEDESNLIPSISPSARKTPLNSNSRRG